MSIDLYEFLEESDREKLLLCQHILEERGQILYFDKLIHQIPISKYKLSLYLEELSQVVQKYGAEISVINNSFQQIHSNGLTKKSIKLLQLEYLKKSLIFELFSKLIVSKLSIKKIGSERFLSRTKVYKVKKHLKEILAKRDISIKGNNLIGNEIAIRQFIFEVYYFFYHGIEFPFSKELKLEVNHIVSVLNSEWILDGTPTKQAKLKNFIGVMLLRINSNQKIKEFSEDFPLLNGKHFERIKGPSSKFLLKYSLSTKTAQRELNYLFVFLLTEDILKIPNVFTIGKMNPTVKQVTRKMMNLFTKKLTFCEEITRSEKAAILKRVTQDLLKLNLKLYFFSPVNFMHEKDEYLLYLKKTYPQFHEITKSFVELILLNDEFKGASNYRTSIYTNYMLCLITSIPVSSFEEKVYVHIDFSKGELYTNFIYTLISRFKNLGVEIQRKLNNDTDIYLSDSIYGKARCRQVIWEGLPTDLDWLELERTVSEIRKKKQESQTPFLNWASKKKQSNGKEIENN